MNFLRSEQYENLGTENASITLNTLLLKLQTTHCSYFLKLQKLQIQNNINDSLSK